MTWGQDRALGTTGAWTTERAWAPVRREAAKATDALGVGWRGQGIGEWGVGSLTQGRWGPSHANHGIMTYKGLAFLL